MRQGADVDRTLRAARPGRRTAMRGATPDFATRTMAGAPDQRRDLSPVADQTSRHTGGNRTSPQRGLDSLLACGESGSCLPGSGCLSEGGDRGSGRGAGRRGRLLARHGAVLPGATRRSVSAGWRRGAGHVRHRHQRVIKTAGVRQCAGRRRRLRMGAAGTGADPGAGLRERGPAPGRSRGVY